MIRQIWFSRLLQKWEIKILSNDRDRGVKLIKFRIVLQSQYLEVPSELLKEIFEFARFVRESVSHEQVEFYENYRNYLVKMRDILKSKVSEDDQKWIYQMELLYSSATEILEKEKESRKEKDETLKNRILIVLLRRKVPVETIDLFERLGYQIDYITLRKELISLSDEKMIKLPGYAQSWRDIKKKTSIELTKNGKSRAEHIFNVM